MPPPIARSSVSLSSAVVLLRRWRAGRRQDNTLLRVRELKAKGTEMLMIWGRQDPHIDRLGRKRILNAMMEADVTFSWHEYNGQHAFMRDEGCAAPHPSKTHVGNARQAPC